MVTDFDPYSKHLTFMAPLSEDRAERLVGFLAGGPTGNVLDIGCGWGELLVRVVAACSDSTGIGIDTDPDAIAQAERRASKRRVDDRTTFIVGDARAHPFPAAASAICIGASQAWATDEGNDGPLDYRLALRSLRELVTRGGRVVYGEGIWSAPPTPQAVAPLAGRPDEFTNLPELVEMAASSDFMPFAVNEASLDEWDEFESGYSARYATWLADHAGDHPDAGEVRDLARQQRQAYLGGYRGVLGMAYLELIAT